PEGIRIEADASRHIGHVNAYLDADHLSSSHRFRTSARTVQNLCTMIRRHRVIEMLSHPLVQREQPFGTNAIDSFSAAWRRIHEPRSLQQLEMLDYGGTRNRQTLSQFAGGHGRARKPLKDDHANRMTE